VAEDYATLYAVNERWPGHAVLVPPVPDTQTVHKVRSQANGIRFSVFYLGFGVLLLLCMLIV
jgi:hypothetical protein